MDIATVQPLMGIPHLQQVLQSTLPQYGFVIRGNSLVVSNGLCTGLQLKLAAPTVVRTGFVIPNMAVQLLWTLTMVLTGILPGLLLYGIIYLVVKGELARMEQNIQTIMRGGSVAMNAPGMAMATGPSQPSKPGTMHLVGAVCSGLIALASLGVVADQATEYMKMQEYAQRDRARSLVNSYSSRSSYSSYNSYGSSENWAERRASARAENATMAFVSFLVFGTVAAALLVLRRRALSTNGQQQWNATGPAQQSQYGSPMNVAQYQQPQQQQYQQQQYQQPQQQQYQQPQQQYQQPQQQYQQPQQPFNGAAPASSASVQSPVDPAAGGQWQGPRY